MHHITAPDSSRKDKNVLKRNEVHIKIFPDSFFQNMCSEFFLETNFLYYEFSYSE